MKKLLAALLVMASLAVLDANAWGRCGRSCAPAAPACPVQVTEQPVPQCFVTETIERPVCPQKFVDISYACPDGSNYRGGAVTKSVAAPTKKGRKSVDQY